MWGPSISDHRNRLSLSRCSLSPRSTVRLSSATTRSRIVWWRQVSQQSLNFLLLGLPEIHVIHLISPWPDISQNSLKSELDQHDSYPNAPPLLPVVIRLIFNKVCLQRSASSCFVSCSQYQDIKYKCIHPDCTYTVNSNLEINVLNNCLFPAWRSNYHLRKLCKRPSSATGLSASLVSLFTTPSSLDCNQAAQP